MEKSIREVRALDFHDVFLTIAPSGGSLTFANRFLLDVVDDILGCDLGIDSKMFCFGNCCWRYSGEGDCTWSVGDQGKSTMGGPANYFRSCYDGKGG